MSRLPHAVDDKPAAPHLAGARDGDGSATPALAVSHDAALAAWFALLPERGPRPGFVLRVMAVLPRRSWLESQWSRGMMVAALAAVALSAGFLIPALAAPGPAGRTGRRAQSLDQLDRGSDRAPDDRNRDLERLRQRRPGSRTRSRSAPVPRSARLECSARAGRVSRAGRDFIEKESFSCRHCRAFDLTSASPGE